MLHHLHDGRCFFAGEALGGGGCNKWILLTLEWDSPHQFNLQYASTCPKAGHVQVGQCVSFAGAVSSHGQ
jgi:hypothetical protein